MKKLLLSISAVFAVSSLMAQYDLEALLETPTEGSSVVASSTTTFQIGIKNNGPNDIPAGDTLWLAYTIGTNIYSLTGTAGQASGMILPQAFPSGVTLTSSMLGAGATITINTSSITTTTPVCFYLIGVNEAIDDANGEDPNDSDNDNNLACFAVTPAPLSVNELGETFVSVFPNPANEVLNIVVNEEIASVVLTTTDGKTVASGNSSNINVASLNAGMYIYQVTTVSGKIGTGNFVKN